MASKKKTAAGIIRDVKKFHKIGVKSLRDRPGRSDLGAKAAEAEAEKLGVNSDYIRKARAFAHPRVGYMENRLQELCDQIKSHYTESEGTKFVFGVSTVFALLAVPVRARKQMEQRLFKNEWSVAELRAEIRRKYGRRRAGGRKRTVGDAGKTIIQLDRFALSWSRWYQSLSNATTKRGKTPLLDELPEAIRTAARRVERAMNELRLATEGVLDQSRSPVRGSVADI